MEMPQTQSDVDAMEKLCTVVRCGKVRAQHPRYTNERYWASDNDFGFWLYPGECALEYEGSLYIVGIRPA